MATGMEFGLLGPLTVRRDGIAIAVPPGKQRVVLAALLLKANQAVSLDELTEALWGERPPASARVSVQNHVKRLRASLGAAGRSRIATEPGGYLIRVAAGELDVSRFGALLGSARAAARDASWEEAATEARAALALWRGEPLAGVDSEVLAAREVPRLTELRLQAAEMRLDADLRLGRHSEVIGELRQLAAAHPLRERLHALLMLALYRDRRQGEALAAYQQARWVLVEELGTEPGSELRELHQRMLTADPALDLPTPARAAVGSGPAAADSGLGAADSGPTAASGPEATVPRELPAGIRHFTGRGSELKELTALLNQAEVETPTVVISAIGGTAGVGKTALAVQWAHQMVDRFPGGQLYVNLRGYDPGQPVAAADALAGFLRALGVPGPDIPAEEDERAARYRSLLAERQVLVLLDNAGSVGQVRPLLPGSPACVVVVTSRDSLGGLVARDGAHRLDLDLLPLAEAVGLLRALVGGRVDADPGAAVALAERCARLPLALRIAAELAAARPDVSLAELVSELAGQQRRLDLLDAGGDPRTAVRAVFSWSYRHLDPEAARAFRLAGLHPGPGFDPCAVAALTGDTVEQARQLLSVLACAHLVQPAGPDRYGMHDLLRAYAAELAAAGDSEQARQAALTGLFDYYLAAAAAAMDLLFPAEMHRRPQPPVPARPVPPPPTPDAARDWLVAEQACLVAAAAQMATKGWPSHAIALGGIVYRYLEAGGHYANAQAVYAAALQAGLHTADLAAQADALRNLGLLDIWQSQYQQAADTLGSALELYHQLGDRLGQARTLGNLGIADWRQGRLLQAADHHQQALALYRDMGDRLGECIALNNLGIVEQRQGHHGQAADHYRESLTLCRELGDRHGEANALDNLGEVLCLQGHYQEAEEHLGCALVIYREHGNRRDGADALRNLGHVYRSQARYQEAADLYRQALAIVREIGARSSEAEALNSIGEALAGAGMPEQAHAHHRDALTMACQIGDPYEQARAHNGLADAYHATGDHGQACHHWQQALALYTDLGAPEAVQVRDQLTAATDADQDKPRPPAGRSG
jgi:DNA-binding SARP family transcriptional activator/tetratricopeptide (TPR) repeat protein